MVPIRGNVDSRLRRLAEGECDALVLARAGLERLGRADEGAPLGTDEMVPAPGQGALALETRSGDGRAQAAVAPLGDRAALACLRAERALSAALGATCRTPLGAHAHASGDGLLALHAFVGLPDGSEWARDALQGDADDPEALGRAVAERLLAAGAGDLLRVAEQTAAELVNEGTVR